MSEFEIIATTFSFIVGLGVAQLLSSITLVIRERKVKAPHWIPLAWAFVILLFSVQYWFALVNFDRSGAEWTWISYGEFLLLAVTLYLAGGLILPSTSTDINGGSLADFNQHGRLALIALSIYLLLWFLPNAHLPGVPILNPISILNVCLATVAMPIALIENHRLRAAGTILFLLLSFVGFAFLWSPPGTAT